MADWEDSSAPDTLHSKMLLNDAQIQTAHPNWPTGGTNAQIGIESNYNNDAVSSKGATGIAQFEPDTFNAVSKQMGRKMDIHNVQDQMDAHVFLMKQNLDRTNGDINGALSLYNSGKPNANNPETTNYISKFNQRTGGADKGGWEDAPDQTSKSTGSPMGFGGSGNGWEDAPEPGAPRQLVQKALGGAPGDAAAAGLQGAGQAGLSMATGLPNQLLDIGNKIKNAFTGKDDAVNADVHNALANFEYEPKTAAGQQAKQLFGQAFDKFVNQPLQSGAQTALGAVPFIGEDLAKSPTAQKLASAGADIAGLIGPGAFLHGMKPGEAGVPVGAPLDSLGKLQEPVDSTMGPNAGPQRPIDTTMGPNAGPPRPPISVDAAGNAVDPLSTDPNMAMYMEQARRAQAAANSQMGPNAGPQRQYNPNMGPNAGPQLPGLFPEQGGEASPYNPNQLSSEVQQPFNARNPTNLRQSQLDFGQAPHQGTLFGNPEGDIGNAGQMAEVSRLQELTRQKQNASRGDLFGDEGNVASPFNPNRLGSDVQEPFGARNPTNLRQRSFDFEAPDERGTLYGDERGNVGGAEQRSDLARLQDIADQHEATARGDLFGDEGNVASPYEPNRLGGGVQEPFAPRRPTNLRQGSLDFDALQHPDRLVTDKTGETGTPEAMAANAPFRDIMHQRMADMYRKDPAQLDIFSEDNARPTGGEISRSMSAEEFTQAAENLARKDGNRFPLPEDMEAAYGKYLDSVHDAQGGLFDHEDIAKHFADAAREDAVLRRVNEHPTVKANASKVAALEAQRAAMQNGRLRSTQHIDRLLDQAKDTLQKSQENIGKQLEPAMRQLLPWEKDGTVNMFTFGHLPEMFKSIAAVLKNLHGVAFRTLDRVLPAMRNLDSPSKIFAQGVKDYVNKQANRDWAQKANQQPMKAMPTGLRAAVNELNPYKEQNISPKELKTQMQSANDLSSSALGNWMRNNILQGGLMISDFSRNPMVKFVTDSVADATRTSDRWVRENLINRGGLRDMVRSMPTKDFTEIRALMEANEGVKEFTDNDLRNRGFNEKQRDYYNRSLELSKQTLKDFNDGRVRAGLPPVEARVAHIAGYFMGDFKQIVTDSGGRVVAVLGHDNRGALKTISQRYKEIHPAGENLNFGPIELRKLKEENRGLDDRFHGYMNILNDLSDSNADVSRIVQTYKDVQMRDTNSLMGMMNRGKFKSNEAVGGAEGRKLWQSMEKNAQDGGKQQLRYLESVKKWTEMQKAIESSQEFIKDPEIDKPNAKSVSQAYLDNIMHRNQGLLARLTNSLANGIAEVTGVGPSQLRGMSSFTKMGLLNMFVGMGKFSHSFVTLIQPLQGIPVVNSLLKARGADLGRTQLSAIAKALGSNKDMLQSMATKSAIKDPFVRDAVKYASDNNTFNTSQFQLGNLTDIGRTRAGENWGKVTHFNVTAPESGTRAFTYMYYAHMMKDLGMPDREAFGIAHNAVQKVMVDYGSEARPGVFNKLGLLGDLTAMLTRFKFNQLSQYGSAGKAFTEGHVMPMVTMLATSLASAGARGFIGYAVANQALGALTTWASKQGLMQKPTNLDQILLHAIHGKNQWLADALNFGLPSALGINMTGSLSHADDIPNDPLGTLLPQADPLMKMGGSVKDVLEHPNSQTIKAAAYDMAPNSVKGIMENTMFTDKSGNYMDPHTGKLVTNRSDGDQTKRDFSFRPLEESKQRLTAAVGTQQTKMFGEVKSEIIKRVLSDVDSNGGKVGNLKPYVDHYVALGGDPNEIGSAIVQHLGIDKHLNIEQREAGIPRGLTSAEKYNRAQELK